VCIALCTIVAHTIAENRADNFPSYPPDNHHCSDYVFLTGKVTLGLVFRGPCITDYDISTYGGVQHFFLFTDIVWCKPFRVYIDRVMRACCVLVGWEPGGQYVLHIQSRRHCHRIPQKGVWLGRPGSARCRTSCACQADSEKVRRKNCRWLHVCLPYNHRPTPFLAVTMGTGWALVVVMLILWIKLLFVEPIYYWHWWLFTGMLSWYVASDLGQLSLLPDVKP